jgi:hypothetical protein
MKSKRMKGWLQNIYNTQDQEISCSECFDLVSQYVELEVSGNDPGQRLPKVKHHIDQCAVCREEYETLLDLARFEDEGGGQTSQDSIH